MTTDTNWKARYPWALRAEARVEPHPGWPPRELWGEGPWDAEPDVIEWRRWGLPCLIVRNGSGALCGYVGVPPTHPDFARHYDAVKDQEAAHGGLTFSGLCGGHICHEPGACEVETVWWLGFDCAHWGDLAPGMQAFSRHLSQIEASARNALGAAPGFGKPVGLTQEEQGVLDAFDRDRFEHYRDVDYVRGCVEELADELTAPLRERRAWWRPGPELWLLLRRELPPPELFGGVLGWRRRPGPLWLEDLCAETKLFFRHWLPDAWRRIYLDLDSSGRGPEEREATRLAEAQRSARRLVWPRPRGARGAGKGL